MTNKKKISGPLPFIMWGLGASFYLFQFVLRVSNNVLEPDLIRDLEADAYGLSLLAAFYYASYSALQIPMGMLVDHFGPRRIVTGSIALLLLGSLLFASAETMAVAQTGRFIMGAGSACAFLSCLKLGSAWFTPEKFAKIVGFTMVFGTIGAMGGGAPLALIADDLGWRSALQLVVALGLIFMALYWFVVRDRPAYQKDSPIDVAKESVTLRANLAKIVREKQNWLIALYALLTYTPITIFGDTWGVPFLMAAYGVERAQAAGAVSMMFLGIAFGAPAVAVLSDRMASRKKAALLGIMGSGITLTTLIFLVPLIPFSATFALFLVAGVFIGGHYLNFTLICERNNRSMGGTATGFVNCVTMSAAFAIHPLIGALLKFLVTDATHTLYEVGDFQVVLSLIPLGLVGAYLAWRHIEETHPAAQKEARVTDVA